MDDKSGRRVAGAARTAAERPCLLFPASRSGPDQQKSSEFQAKLFGAEALTQFV